MEELEKEEEERTAAGFYEGASSSEEDEDMKDLRSTARVYVFIDLLCYIESI